jgi:hypothetical protein
VTRRGTVLDTRWNGPRLIRAATIERRSLTGSQSGKSRSGTARGSTKWHLRAFNAMLNGLLRCWLLPPTGALVAVERLARSSGCLRRFSQRCPLSTDRMDR